MASTDILVGIDIVGLSWLGRWAQRATAQAQRIGDIIMGKRAITGDTALRLSRYFGLSDEYWLRAQLLHDLESTRSLVEAELRKILPRG